MNPIDIEKKDRNFVRKLNDLRSRLEVRQLEYQERTWPRFSLRRALLFICPLLVIGMGFALLRVDQNATSADGHQQDASAITQKEPPPESVVPWVVQREALQDHPSSVNQTLTPPVPKTPAHPAPFVPMEADKQLAMTPADTKVPTTGAPPVDTTQVELVSAHLCEGVHERKPLAKREVFHPSIDKRAYLWMEVNSKEQPFVMQHIYYRNDRKYCEVSLEIRFPRMRTWSYVTLVDADQVGRWRVEIACNERVLKTLSFRVRGK
jgi:hypothetical protein